MEYKRYDSMDSMKFYEKTIFQAMYTSLSSSYFDEMKEVKTDKTMRLNLI